MAKNKIQYTGEFDVSGILKSLRDIENQMKDMSETSSIFSGVDKDFDKISKLIINIKSQLSQGFSDSKDIASFSKNINSLYENLNHIETELKEISTSGKLEIKGVSDAEEEIKNYKDEIKNLKKSLKTTKKDLSNVFQNIGYKKSDADGIAAQISNIDDLKNKLKEIIKQRQKELSLTETQAEIDKQRVKAEANEKVSNLVAKGGAKVNKKSSAASNQEEARTFVNQIASEEMSKVLSGAQNIKEAWENIQKEINEVGIELTNNETISNKLQRIYSQLQSSTQEIENNLSLARDNVNVLGEIDSEGNIEFSEMGQGIISRFSSNTPENIENQTEELQHTIDVLQQEIQELENSNGLEGITEQLENIQEATDEARVSSERYTGEAEETIKIQERMTEKFDNMKNAVKTFLSITSVVNGLKNVIRSTFEDIKNLDKSFASIAMVTDYSVDEMWESYDQYADMAERLGQKTSDVIQASGLFYQQGLDTAEALELTNDTLTLATLAGSNFETATEQMTAALRGFHMEMNEGTRVTDVYSELAAKAAADVDGIAYAISKTASIANNAGMSFENTSAFLTQMIETTQEAPENLGTAMKTIIARFTELKENVAGTDKSEFDDLDYNKVDTALKSVGISLKDANGQFRDLDDVFLELSSKWDTLDRNSQRYVATIAAGSRQQSRFIAMMENYERTMELVDVAQNASGKSAEQFAKSQDTVEAKMNQISTAWEQLRVSFLDSETFKSTLDIVKNLVTTLGNMDFTQILSLGLIGLTLGKSVITNFIKGIQSGSASVTTAMNQFKAQISDKFSKNQFSFKYDEQSIQKFEQRLSDAGLQYDRLSAKQKNMLITFTQMVPEIKKISNEYNIQYSDLVNLDNEAYERWVIENNIDNEIQEQIAGYRRLVTEIKNAKNAEQQRQAQAAMHGIANADDNSNFRGGYNRQPLGTKGQIASDALSTGIITALMMAISGADLTTILTTSIGSALTSAISVIVPKLITTLITKIVAAGVAATVGVITAVATAAVAITAIIWKIHDNIEKANVATEKAELNRLKNVEKTNQDLQEKQISALQKVNSAKKQQEEVQELVDRFNFLSNKSFLTENENTELSDVKNKITSNYSDLVLDYDEQTEALRLNTLALENLTEQYKKDEETALKEAQFAQVSLITNTNAAQETAEKIAEKYGKFANMEGLDKARFTSENVDTLRLSTKNNTYVEDKTFSGLAFKNLKRDLEEGFGVGSALYKSLGLEAANLDNYEALNEYLESTGRTLQEFTQIIEKAAKEKAKELEKETLIQARQGAENIYMSYDFEESTMSEELARSLSYSVKEEDLDFESFSMSDFKKSISKGNETDKNFLRDYLQAIQEGKSTSDSGGVSTALQEMRVTADKTADDIIREKIAEWEEKEEKLMEGTDGNLNSWVDLPKEMQDYLTTAGYTEKDWDDIKDNAEESKKAIDGFFYNLLLKEQEAFGTLSEEQISTNEPELAKINELLTNINSLTQEEFLNQLTQTVEGLDEEVRDAFLAGQGLKWDGSKVVMAQEAVQDAAFYAFTEAIESFKTLKVTGAEDLNLSVQQSILDAIKKANLDIKTSGQFGQNLVNFFNKNNIDSEAQNVLASIDLTQSYSDLLTNSQSYIEQLQESGYSSEQASKVFNDYISSARNYIFSAISTLEGVTVLRENINANLSGMSEKYSSLLEAQKEYQEEGTLSSETYYKLLEEGFDEYVKVTGKGYELLGNNVADAYNQETLSQYKTYLASIEDQQKTIETLENAQVTHLVNGKYNYVTSLKNTAEYYKKNKDGLEEYKGEYKQLIQEFIDSGLIWDEYIQNLKNVKQEMEDQKSEVYIQSLHTITDAYDDAAKEVQELADDLADLTEQEEEDKKAKDEAYQAWQDAIHGSEDYQSSLDGLFNYEKRLDSLNDKLEETKEALSDISSIEEAKDLLQNTQSLYENKLGTLQAQNKVIDQSIKNLDEEILKNYGDFVGFDEFGNMTVDTRKLEDADMSDILKDDGFTQLIEKRVEMKDKLDEGNKEILETEKAWNEQLKEAREGQIAIEEKVIDILKEKMQKEIDATNEKYAALEEADNNYLDALQEAIDKQRELREQENQYEDLATKQKKLSLMQRDTSGANQKEVQSLEKEIDEDRQSLLDSEVDNLIESMRELYEKQQEARELEIEAMEAATENMQVINETALNIISGFQTAEDYQAWLMENDTSVEDMTVTQTEAYLDEAKETFSGYAQYVALTAEDMALRTDEINANADAVFENTSENVTTIGTTIQDLAEAAADKAETEAKEAYDDAVDKWNKTQDKIAETTNKLNAAEANAISTHQSTMNALVDASQSGMADVAEFAVSELAALTGLDLGGDSKKVKEFLEEHNLITEDGGISQGVYNAITAAGGDTSGYTVSNARYSLKAVSSSGLSTISQFATQEAAEAEKQRRIAEGSTSQYVIDKTDLDGKPVFDKHGIKWPDGTVNNYLTEDDANKAIERIKKSNDQTSENKQKKAWIDQGEYEIFKTGGLVNYTGPAWVDGTPSKPEAFLSAQDTERIGSAAKLLADLPTLNSTSNANNAVSSNIGDTSIEIHINVESLASDYDVDQMIERVKNDILDVSKPTGTSVILHK